MSHLSHPQAHVKKYAQAQKADSLGNDGDIDHLNGLTSMPSDGVAHPFVIAPVSDGMNNMAGDQDLLFCSGSASQDRNDMAPNMGAPQPYGLMFLHE